MLLARGLACLGLQLVLNLLVLVGVLLGLLLLLRDRGRTAAAT